MVMVTLHLSFSFTLFHHLYPVGSVVLAHSSLLSSLFDQQNVVALAEGPKQCYFELYLKLTMKHVCVHQSYKLSLTFPH